MLSAGWLKCVSLVQPRCWRLIKYKPAVNIILHGVTFQNVQQNRSENLKSCNVEVIFLPPNISPILQPLGEGVRVIFKAYCLKLVMKSLFQTLTGQASHHYKNYGINRPTTKIRKEIMFLQSGTKLNVN